MLCSKTGSLDFALQGHIIIMLITFSIQFSKAECHGWPSWLDHGALINADAPGCGSLVAQGRTGHK